MKKLFVLFLFLFIVTGCSSNVTFDFTEENIKSNIDVEFNQEEFKTYINKNTVHTEDRFATKETTEEFIIEKYNEASIIALKKNDKYEYYVATDYKKENNNYKYSYTYDYEYEDFSKNYYINECFEYFFLEEDENYYHYNIKGNYTCSDTNNMKITIKSDKKNIKSNSTKIKDDKHIWEIVKEGNNIVFSVSKENKEEKENSISAMQIIGIVLIIILAGLSILFYKLTKKTD